MSNQGPNKHRRRRGSRYGWKSSFPPVALAATVSLVSIPLHVTAVFSQSPEATNTNRPRQGVVNPLERKHAIASEVVTQRVAQDRFSDRSTLGATALGHRGRQLTGVETTTGSSSKVAARTVTAPTRDYSTTPTGRLREDEPKERLSRLAGPSSGLDTPRVGTLPFTWPGWTWPVSLFDTFVHTEGTDGGAVLAEPSLMPDFSDDGVIVEDGPLTSPESVATRPVVDVVWCEVGFALWKRRGHRLPALVTTEPNGGVLPDATVLFGDERVGQGPRPGGRFRVGVWSDETQYFGWEAGLTVLGEAQVRFQADSGEVPLLARPFFNFTDDLQGGFVGQDAFLVAEPGFSTGVIVVQTGSDVLTADVTCRRVFRLDGQWRVDLLAGYMTARIDESLWVTSTTDITGQGTQIIVEDLFATKNAFHGGHLGLQLQRGLPHGATLDVLARVGFGNMRQWVTIAGMQETISAGQSTVEQSGLLAQSTNIGLHRRDVFAVAPEIHVHYEHPLSDHLQLLAGYSFLYWNRVAQPADQLDPQLGVNPNQPPPPGEPQRPTFLFRDGDFYVHGVDVGLRWTY